MFQFHFYGLFEHVRLPMAQERGMGRGQKRKVLWFNPSMIKIGYPGYVAIKQPPFRTHCFLLQKCLFQLTPGFSQWVWYPRRQHLFGWTTKCHLFLKICFVKQLFMGFNILIIPQVVSELSGWCIWDPSVFKNVLWYKLGKKLKVAVNK